MTDLAGTVSMLYGMLLHQDTPMRDEKSVPPKLPPHTTAVAQTLIYNLHHGWDLQASLGQSAVNPEVRAVITADGCFRVPEVASPAAAHDSEPPGRVPRRHSVLTEGPWSHYGGHWPVGRCGRGHRRNISGSSGGGGLV